MVNDVLVRSSAVCIFLLIVFIHLSIKSTLESDSFTMQALAIFIFMEKFFGLYAPFFPCIYIVDPFSYFFINNLDLCAV